MTPELEATQFLALAALYGAAVLLLAVLVGGPLYIVWRRDRQRRRKDRP